MKTETRQRIKDSILAHNRQRYPNMPQHTLPQPKVQETSANALTRTIIEFLRAEGWQAERINTMGVPRVGKDMKNASGGIQRKGTVTWTKGTGTPGSADISATIRGRSVKIEIKFGKDRQSDYQKQYQADIERAGGVYWIVRDLDGFLDMYDEFIEQCTK